MKYWSISLFLNMYIKLLEITVQLSCSKSQTYTLSTNKVTAFYFSCFAKCNMKKTMCRICSHLCQWQLIYFNPMLFRKKKKSMSLICKDAASVPDWPLLRASWHKTLSLQRNHFLTGLTVMNSWSKWVAPLCFQHSAKANGLFSKRPLT